VLFFFAVQFSLEREGAPIAWLIAYSYHSDEWGVPLARWCAPRQAGCARRSVGSPATTCGVSRDGRRRDVRSGGSVSRWHRCIGGGGSLRVAPPFVRGVGLVGGGLGAGPASGGRCTWVRAARRRGGIGARWCWELRPSTAGSGPRSNTGCCGQRDRHIMHRITFCAVALQQNPASLGARGEGAYPHASQLAAYSLISLCMQHERSSITQSSSRIESIIAKAKTWLVGQPQIRVGALLTAYGIEARFSAPLLRPTAILVAFVPTIARYVNDLLELYFNSTGFAVPRLLVKILLAIGITGTHLLVVPALLSLVMFWLDRRAKRYASEGHGLADKEIIFGKLTLFTSICIVIGLIVFRWTQAWPLL
jgi:hypothetical protein